ncbi:uncharacterized protein LOC111024092 [Momordica charantia]|uniref:Uncharacterized protein LOC111024092 n=1 Tax=Momordica charantia TaxID=3673 RepID=A0A6J1DUB4_MOMCH|nr:uncharacterized protein LOC111024092 [Momordica charantia]XP_022157373.1 uncharacterized protein LOC111024092 [Momordica charantia]XP_022157374.1 uncharacterized protein LOC111024092 [Momordica charantia]XP_022157375.1 uncharacterized protein LOC111024092 [Momordica charantia]XP_022157377.1 uncharacterized protein LOC111024092 [Momordica charantia]XP_022157378.1 uncharacterized protein LOC111024092 [Momordica charantia]XP_022157379.1 uncharacterized protein LOC111024092 [Momordica charanti
MSQPPGFSNPSYPNHAWMLKRSLYDLNKHQEHGLIDYLYFSFTGFTCSTLDPSFFIFKQNHILVLMLICVDDIILTGNNQTFIMNLVTKLSTEFALKDLGALHYFLGVEVQHTHNGFHITQSRYTRDILMKAKMLEVSPISTPMATSKNKCPHENELVDPTAYRSLVGSLQYLTLTRPDIHFYVNKACQHMQQPQMQHLRDVKCILRYLKHSLNHGISFRKNSSLNLYAFCDADWAACPTTRRSTSGIYVFLGSNIISWSSKKQPTVSRSSSKAEYRSIANATAELTWITFLLRDIGIPLTKPPELFSDNMSALQMSINPVFHAIKKHIELDYHFVHEKVALGSLITQYIPTHDQLADICTKPLPKNMFKSLASKQGVRALPTTSLRTM